ncbi:MAG TPA: MarR family transcriptional regulator [Steroidobacteraceae bacterium]|nr:MarR family transcriptional regulator [Steroidobacteraceae bacterium]
MHEHPTLGFLLKDVTRLYTRRFEERAQALSLTLPQCKALTYLARNEGVSQKRLAELIEIDPMSLVRILDRMEADGWVERRADPQDRRARCLVVTDQARPIIELVWQIVAETRAEALAGLTDPERAQLMSLLERAHVNLLALSPLGESERITIAARRPASAA